ncbi:MAG: hypothetical protein ABL958_04005 [Bdellovibrionia bacterium]
MKRILLLTVMGLVAAACGKVGERDEVASLADPKGPGQYAHKTSGTANGTVAVAGSSNTSTTPYELEFDNDEGNAIHGKHNFRGIRNGFNRVAGTKNGNTITYHSIECNGDTFNGTYDLTNGAGTFDGTICDHTFSGGILTGMTLEY